MNRTGIFTVSALVLVGILVFVSTQFPSGKGAPSGINKTGVEPPKTSRVAVAELSPETERRIAGKVAIPVIHGAEVGYVTGVIEDLNGIPVPGADCQLIVGSEPMGLGSLAYREPADSTVAAQAVSDEQGTFRLSAEPGFYNLRIESEGFTPWEEAHLSPGDFKLIQLYPDRDILVTVSDEANNPIADAVVSLMRGQYYDPRSAVDVQQTNRGGKVQFEQAPSGTWFVHVQHPKYVGTVVQASSASDVGASVRVTLKEGLQVVGKVTTDGGLIASRPARIQFDTLTGFTTSHETTSGLDGNYYSKSAFPKDSILEVSVLLEGYGEARRSVDFGAADYSNIVEVDFELRSTERRAIGAVVDPQGNPVEGIEVFVKVVDSLPEEATIQIPSAEQMKREGNPDLTAYKPVESKVARFRPSQDTDTNGQFEIRGLHPGAAYKILLLSAKHANRVLWCPPGPEGETVEFGTVALEKAGKLFGNVRTPDGRPIEGALVYIVELTTLQLIPNSEFVTKRPDRQVGLLDSITTADGYFSIQPLPKSNFMLMCLGTLFGPYAVEEGQTLGPLELITETASRIASSRTVTVKLAALTEEGEPIPKGFITMKPMDSSPTDDNLPVLNDVHYMFVNDDGLAERKVAPGEYEVLAIDLSGQYLKQTRRIEVNAGDGGKLEPLYLQKSPHPAQELTGRVVDSNGDPLADMEVSLLPATGDVSCSCMKFVESTDPTGAFSFGMVLKGNHRIVVTDPKQGYSAAHHYPAQPGNSFTVEMK